MIWVIATLLPPVNEVYNLKCFRININANASIVIKAVQRAFTAYVALCISN